MSPDHRRILRAKLIFVVELVEALGDGPRDDDVVLVLADLRSSVGKWIRGPCVFEMSDASSIASFAFCGADARRLLGDVASVPGLVVLVVDAEDAGFMIRFISGAQPA